MATAPQKLTAIIQNTRVIGLRVLTSEWAGRCDNTGRWFQKGTEILYKAKNDLLPVEADGVFGSRGMPVYAIRAILVDTEIVQDEAPFAHPAPIAPARSAARDEYRESRRQQVSGTGKPKFEPSTYQKNILQTVLSTTHHVLIRALAGSGKTSTLVWLLYELLERGLTRGKNIVYLAFNVNIKNELQHKLLGTNIPAKTTHGFGLSEWLKVPANVRVMKGNLKNQHFFLKGICDRLEQPFNDDTRKIAKKSVYWEVRKQVYELVTYIKNWAVCPAFNPDGGWRFSVAQITEIESFLDRYKMTVPADRRREVVDWACTVVALSTPAPGEPITFIDFDDMLFLPLVLDAPTPIYDTVLTDESQDFNRAQLMMLERLALAGARIIAVGDENQGLYRFRGAAGRAMSWLGELFIGTDLGLATCELPVNYRSDRAIIRWATQWVPDLLGSKKVDGDVTFEQTVAQAIDNAKNDVDHSYAFLCRTNLPLVVTAYQLIAKRKRIHILGKDTFGGPILGLIADLCGRSDEEVRYCNRISDRRDQFGEVIEEGLLTRLANHMKTQREKMKDESFKFALEVLESNAECIEIIASNIVGDTVDAVRDEISNLLADEPQPGVINLATIHGAKGLEWDTVFIIRPDLLPHPMVPQYEDDSDEITEEYQQELNACYVAATRARHSLHYVINWPFGKGMGPIKFLLDDLQDGGTVESPKVGGAAKYELRSVGAVQPRPTPALPQSSVPADDETPPDMDDGKPFIY